MRNFEAFLQHSGEIGKTLAEMSIESHVLGHYNQKHQADCSCPHIGPAKGASNEQL
ncbi:hypothetical protein ACLB1Q_27040 [Escherichia coli]